MKNPPWPQAFGQGKADVGLEILHGPRQKDQMSMDDTTPICDYCNEPLEQGEGEFSWNCINPDCLAQFEFQEGRMVLTLAPIGER